MLIRNTVVFFLFITAAITAREKELVILQTSDVHGRIEFGTMKQGWLKLSTLIAQERKKVRGRCLYVDCGDSIQGTYSSALFRGEPSIAALNYLKPDAWVPGNHELDFGISRLAELIEKARFPVLNGNLTLRAGLKAPMKPYRLIVVNGLKVAVIGMNTGRLKSGVWGKDYTDFDESPAVTSLKKLLPRVQRESPNLIVLAIHQGLLDGRKSHGEVYTICKLFPQIKLILAGHTHTAIPGKRIWGCYVVEPGEHGAYLSKVTASFTKDGQLTGIRSALLDATAVKPDASLRSVLNPYLQATKKASFTVIAQAPAELKPGGTPGVDNAMSDLFCRALLSKTGADAVFHGTHNGLSWRKGPVQQWQVFASIPYENGIGVATLTEPELKVIIAEQLAMKIKDNMLGVYGIKAHINRDGKTVDRIEMPAGRHTVSVAFSSFAIAGGVWRFPVLRSVLAKHTTLHEFPDTTRAAVVEYLKQTPDWYRDPQKWLVFH